MSDDAASSSRLQAEASAWFARLQAREVSAEALSEFRTWRKLPGRREAYAHVEALWSKAGELDRDPDIAAALEEARARRPAPPGRALVWATLGGLASLALISALYWTLQRGAVETGIGEQRTLRLADGSRLQLDTKTRVKVAFKDDLRLVHLERGQVFLDVAKDPQRPFEVRAGETRIRALGTRFDVRREGDVVKAVLVAGAIEVESRAGGQPRRWRLAPGQEVTPAALAAKVRPANLATATSWTSGRTIFEGVPLAEAAREMNRYSRTKVTIADPRSAQVQVSGAFDSGDMTAFVEAVTALHPLRADTVSQKEIRLSPVERPPAV